MPLHLRRSLPAILLLLLCAGCGETVSLIGLRFGGVLDHGFTTYHAYGDSITYGYGLADPAKEGYPARIAKGLGLPLANYAINGDQACDVSSRQIFPHADLPSTVARGLYSILISTNDVNVKGAGAYNATFALCLRAAISWLAVPLEQKIMANANSVTTVGTVVWDPSNHWNSLITNAPGATIMLPLHLASRGSVYLWYRLDDSNSGVFSYAIDGATVGSATTSTDPLMRTSNGTVNSLGMLRLLDVDAGTHILTVTQTSSSGQVGVVAAGLPSGDLGTGMSRVLVGTTPLQLHGAGGAACTDTDAPCLAYIASITSEVALFASDGLDVRLFDSRKYMTGTQRDMADPVHPNATGNLEIGQALADALN